jgi:hypothetical protein
MQHSVFIDLAPRQQARGALHIYEHISMILTQRKLMVSFKIAAATLPLHHRVRRH